jgi:hypothetical protein
LDQDWENRVLCSDGNCIGVIGADGRCKECGKPYEGRLPKGFDSQNVTAAPEGQDQTTSEAAVDDAEQAPTGEPDRAQQTTGETAGGDDWDNRVLCSDGNCIGVIGADGRCKECGKPYTPDSIE